MKIIYHNTDDGGQAMGEELRHVEMRCIMHRRETEKSNQQHTRVMRWHAINTLSEQKQGQRPCYPQKSWRCNAITHGL